MHVYFNHFSDNLYPVGLCLLTPFFLQEAKKDAYYHHCLIDWLIDLLIGLIMIHASNGTPSRLPVWLQRFGARSYGFAFWMLVSVPISLCGDVRLIAQLGAICRSLQCTRALRIIIIDTIVWKALVCCDSCKTIMPTRQIKCVRRGNVRTTLTRGNGNEFVTRKKVLCYLPISFHCETCRTPSIRRDASLSSNELVHRGFCTE
jgi:hypothetical protein